MLRLKRRRAGFYVTEDETRAIIRTDWPGEGPRGGNRYLWELATADNNGTFTIDGVLAYMTLRDARAALEKGVSIRA